MSGSAELLPRPRSRAEIAHLVCPHSGWTELHLKRTASGEIVEITKWATGKLRMRTVSRAITDEEFDAIERRLDARYRRDERWREQVQLRAVAR